MNFLGKYKVSFAAILIGLLGFIGLSNLTEFTKEYPNTVVFIVFLLMCVIGHLIDIQISSRKRTNISIDKTKWNHSILIFDDKSSDLATIMDCLKGYNFDIVTLKDISDYRLAENFEIIIGDIWGLGAAGKNSISVLNNIKMKYPYKIVLAMSSAPAICKGLKVDDEIISKENKGEYPQKILQRINFYSTKLDNVDDYWKEVSIKLADQQISKIEQEKIKERYYDFVKSRLNLS